MGRILSRSLWHLGRQGPITVGLAPSGAQIPVAWPLFHAPRCRRLEHRHPIALPKPILVGEWGPEQPTS